MTDLRRDVQDDHGIKKRVTERTREPRQQRKRRARTAGTDRDFDERGTSDNQAHGHPREESRPQLDRPAGDG